jgi:hypothetical protein
MRLAAYIDDTWRRLIARVGYVETSLAQEDDLVKRTISTRNGLALVAVGLLVTTLTGCNASSTGTDSSPGDLSKQPSTTPSADSIVQSGQGMGAISEAGDAGKYLFLFSWKADDEQTRAMRKVFDSTMEKVADRAQPVVVNINDTTEKPVVAKYGLDRAPMPLVLVIAPNGAVTGGFPNKFEEQQLLSAFATPATAKVMKRLQDGKLVFLCVQNEKTKSNDAALQGVWEFKEDVRFASATEIIMLDPADSKEASFLSDLKIDPKTAEAVTVFLAPPGSAIAEYKGATQKVEIVATLQKASSGCCPGGSCGPGGCCPAK